MIQNLKSLSNDVLIVRTSDAVKTERLSTAIVVKHFEEIYRRKLYLECGYPTMFDMATKRFGFCAGAAQRRINSMKLIRDLPEVEVKIESGELSLTAAAVIYGFFVTEAKEKKPFSKTEKLAVVQLCLNKSTREVERELVTISPEREKRESLKYTSDDRLRLSISISEDLHQKLTRLKEIWSHSSPDFGTEWLIERMAEIALDKVDPVRISARISKRIQAHKTDDLQLNMN